MSEKLVCAQCSASYPVSVVRYECDCGGLLAVERNTIAAEPSLFDERRASRRGIDASGVWRFREGVLDIGDGRPVSHPEGDTRLYERFGVFFKHEGENPTGSFKDRGMTVAVTQAVRHGARAVACASTGNTSASLAAYAAQAGLKAVVFIPAGKVSAGKLGQTLAYGATCLEVRGDFDAAMRLVREASTSLGIYLVNSINPFRLEGQKTIMLELLQQLGWEAPDWVVLPAGNKRDLRDVPSDVRDHMQFHYVERMDQIFDLALLGEPRPVRLAADGETAPVRREPERQAAREA